MWPLITHSSPSRTARGLQQRRVRAGRVGLGHAERRLQVAGQQRVQVALLLLRRPGEREDLGVARVRRCVAERERRDRAGAEDLVHQPELDLAESLPAELGVEMRGPQALRLDLRPAAARSRASGRPSRARRSASRAARSARGRTRASSRAWTGTQARWRNPMAWREAYPSRLPSVCASLGSSDATAAPRPPDLDRRVVPASGRARRRTCTSVGCCVFDGPPPAFDDYLDHVRGRLHLVPRYRQKLVTPPLETGRPLWVDDPNFNLEYHVRHAALPSPGHRGAAVPARLADRLPAARPLEAAVGELAGRGTRGRSLRADLQDPPLARRRRLGRRPRDRAVRPRPTPAPPPTDLEPWQPKPEPSPAELVLAGVRGARQRDRRDRRACARRAATRRRRSLGIVRDAAEGLGEIVWAGLNPAPADPAERRDRAAPPLRRRAPAARASTRRSRTRSAGRSTTSC